MTRVTVRRAARVDDTPRRDSEQPSAPCCCVPRGSPRASSATWCSHDVDLDLRAGPGARPGRRERRRQVDADEDPRRRPPARRAAPSSSTASRCRFSHPVQAQQAGLSTVFQEFNLLPERTVAENVYLGREPRRRGLVDTARMQPRHRRSSSTTSASPASRAGQRVRALSVAEQQVVEIAKAISFDARIIQMDEPTAALADHEVELLYAIIRRLTDRGVAILYVSHRLKEIFDLCDTITVLKDGAQVATRPAAELDDAELVRLMVGRSISSFFPDPLEGTEIGEPRLELRGAGNGYVDGVDLTLRAGEVVGVAGLQGSGRTELLEAVFGVTPLTRGELRIDGRPVRARVPARRRPRGLAHGHRGPQGHRARAQPDDPRQRARRRPQRSSPGAPARARARGARPALLARGLRPGDGPGGAVPLRRQPAEGRARPLAHHPARAWC